MNQLGGKAPSGILAHCNTQSVPGTAFTRRPEYPPAEPGTGAFSEAELSLVNARDSRCPRPLTYLACPYSYPDPAVKKWRYEQCTRAAAWLIQQEGWNVFSPITHSHPLHELGGCRGDWHFWEKIDKEYLSVSQRVVVLLLEGWKTSVGVTAEVQIAAHEEKIEIRYLAVHSNGLYDWVSDPELVTPFAPPFLSPVAENIWPIQIPPDQPTKVPEGMTNPKDLIGLTKPPLRLVPAALLLYVSQVMQDGANKYGPYNWRQKKVRLCIYIEAAMRHLLALVDGEDDAPDSHKPHAAHAAACMGIILDAKATGNLIDDRPTPGAAARLIAEMTEAKQV